MGFCMMVRTVLLVFLFCSACAHILVPMPGEMDRLLTEADKDGDRKITVDDRPGAFELQTVGGGGLKVEGPYYLSNLLQELKLAQDRGPDTELDKKRIFENPVERISRSIRERYWDNLTRRVDAAHLEQALVDPKLPPSEFKHVYVPADDTAALAYFQTAAAPLPAVKVWALPATLGDKEMREIAGRQGLLTLALQNRGGRIEGVPFVVPGGRFNEMYGWDSYFESLGLIVDGRVDLAKAMADNFIYEIEHYGKILNANRTYYLNRSQPPFLTSLLQAVREQLPKTPENEAWFQRGVKAAIAEYEKVWDAPERRTDTGLNRYYGSGHGIPPEVEKGHFDFILLPAARKQKIPVAGLIEEYNAGRLKDPELDEFFASDRAVRESGHDTTYRWRVNGKDRAADFVTVDLNSLLYKYETDLAKWTGDPQWTERAEKRKAAMFKYMWDPKRKIFFDYNFKDKKRSQYVSATAFYPMWARLIDMRQGKASLHALLEELETPGGIVATSLQSLLAVADPNLQRQWDYPNGWAPHQMMAWQALKNYGENKARDRLIYKWLYTIARNAADYNGTIPEKFDVVKRSHAVFAEYGNVGTEFAYITQEGFGWMNASFQVGLKELPAALKAWLHKLTPPEELKD